MEPYKNLGGDSNVVAYKTGEDRIIVQFASGQWTTYTYTYTSAGSSAVETMKSLAHAGHGLNSYIGTHKPRYASKA